MYSVLCTWRVWNAGETHVFSFFHLGRLWQNMRRHWEKQTKESMIFTKPAQASKKTKKTKHDLHKTCTGIKKNKKTKLLWSIDPQPWVDAQSFVFFVFFDACAGFVHLVVCFFFVFVDACAGFVTLTFTKHAQASKKTKKTKHDLHKTCTGIQKNKKDKTFVIYRPPTLSRCSEFCFFLFFLMPVQVLCI